MKKTKIFAGFTAFAFAVSLGFLSCSNNNDDDDEKEVSIYDTNDNLVSSESIAFNILRDLCDLKNEEGDEELPDGWETKSFDSDIGTTFPAEISDGTIRYVACESADAAAEYFHELIGSDSNSWSDSKAGTFTFEKADSTDDEDLYATLTVESSRIKNLSVLKFYSAEGIKASIGENSGNVTYYHAGDIVSRDSDGTVWMCVKPAGGPSNEKNSYWMCLDPFAKKGNKAGTCIIKQDKEIVKVSYDRKIIDKKWIYAKNLMSLDTAKAAYHTFNALCNGNGTNAQAVYNAIKAKGYDIGNLSNNGENFCFAFGSPKNDKERVSRKSRVMTVTINSQTTYVQPFFIGKVGSEDSIETTAANYSNPSGAKTMLAVTDAYDRNYLTSFYRSFESYLLKVSEDENDGYTYLDYIHSVDENGKLNYKGTLTWMENIEPQNHPEAPSYPYHIIFSPELTIKDTGKKASAFTEIYISGDDNAFDYWSSL